MAGFSVDFNSAVNSRYSQDSKGAPIRLASEVDNKNIRLFESGKRVKHHDAGSRFRNGHKGEPKHRQLNEGF